MFPIYLSEKRLWLIFRRVYLYARAAVMIVFVDFSCICYKLCNLWLSQLCLWTCRFRIHCSLLRVGIRGITTAVPFRMNLSSTYNLTCLDQYCRTLLVLVWNLLASLLSSSALWVFILYHLVSTQHLYIMSYCPLGHSLFSVSLCLHSRLICFFSCKDCSLYEVSLFFVLIMYIV